MKLNCPSQQEQLEEGITLALFGGWGRIPGLKCKYYFIKFHAWFWIKSNLTAKLTIQINKIAGRGQTYLLVT